MVAVRVIAVAILLGFGGCSGLVPGFDANETEPTPTAIEGGADVQATATPSSDGTVTETRTDAEPDYLAPGLTAEGVLNISLLLDRHFAVLERESGDGTYVAIERRTGSELSFPTEKIFSSQRRYVVQHPDRWRSVDVQTNETANETTIHEAWANESIWVLRVDRPNEPVEYDARARYAPPGHPKQLEWDLRSRLRSVDLRRSINVTVEERTRDDSTVFVVSDTTQTASATVTTTVYVRDDGYVIRFSQESIRELRSGESIFISRYMTFEADPDGDFESPDWIEDAHEAPGDEETADE